MTTAPAIFDAHVHPATLSDEDLESMAFFGVSRALAFADHFSEATPAAVLETLDALVHVQLPRLQRAGIEAFAAVGLHPRCVPRRGLKEVLAALPEYFRGGKVAAIGETGFHTGGPKEEEAFAEQLSLARRLNLPVVIHTPAKEKERFTRLTLNLLRASGLPADKALVDHANAKTVQAILSCGHFAGLTLHPDELKAETAVRLVRKLGSTRIVLNSDSGDRAGDILSAPRAYNLLLKAKLSRSVCTRVAHENIEMFLGLA